MQIQKKNVVEFLKKACHIVHSTKVFEAYKIKMSYVQITVCLRALTNNLFSSKVNHLLCSLFIIITIILLEINSKKNNSLERHYPNNSRICILSYNLTEQCKS